MKIAIYGAGAIGGHLAARLVRGGADVSVIARGAQLSAIQTHGIRIVAPDLDEVVPVAASDDAAAFGAQDAALELGRLAGVATPTLDRLVALTKVRARAAGLYS